MIPERPLSPPPLDAPHGREQLRQSLIHQETAAALVRRAERAETPGKAKALRRRAAQRLFWADRLREHMGPSL